MVGTTSVACRNWWRISPCAGYPRGHEMTSGSATPPSKLYRFHILNGVLNAHAQPDRVVVVGRGRAEQVEVLQVRFDVVGDAVEEQ